MKKLLLLTDFSANSTRAAEYCNSLATQVHANVVLCNIVTIPTDNVLAATVVWPVYDHDTLMDDSATALKALTHQLNEQNKNHQFKPNISAINKGGPVIDAINEIANDVEPDMLVMGTHTPNGLNTFILGDHAKEMIDTAKVPLLLVPGTTEVRPVKKIAYATNFADPDYDLNAIFHLINFAKLMNAEVLIVHTHDERHTAPAFKKPLDGLLLELSNKADYANIYYRIVQSRNPEAGLDWLCEHGQIDILAMLHRPKNFIEEVFKHSYTKRMANHIHIPLLVFPIGMR